MRFALIVALLLIAASARADGGIVTQYSADCSAYMTAGSLCWNTTTNNLYVGNGSVARLASFDNHEFIGWANPTPASTMNGKLLSMQSNTNFNSEGSSTAFSDSAIPLGTSQAFVKSLNCILVPFAGTWDNGADDFTFQVMEYDASHAAGAGVAVGSPVSTPANMTVATVPGTENVISSTINAFTTLTGGGHYLAVKVSATDAQPSVTTFTTRCSLIVGRAF